MEEITNKPLRTKDRIMVKAKDLINWSALSAQKKLEKGSIRANRIPETHKEDIEQLLYYIDCWLNCKELTTKGELKAIVKDELQIELKELVMKIQTLGKNL